MSKVPRVRIRSFGSEMRFVPASVSDWFRNSTPILSARRKWRWRCDWDREGILWRDSICGSPQEFV